jgi:hypothetical protein
VFEDDVAKDNVTKIIHEDVAKNNVAKIIHENSPLSAQLILQRRMRKPFPERSDYRKGSGFRPRGGPEENYPTPRHDGERTSTSLCPRPEVWIGDGDSRNTHDRGSI